jgi:hypothetical protein
MRADYEAAWEAGFAHLEQYIEEHGDARVPQRFKTEDGYKLGTWVQSQRNSRSTMSAERLTRLEGLGFVWDTRDYVTSSWEENFGHLEQYVEAHGDARVPQRFKTEDGYKLGTWVQSQRNTRSTMSAERVTRLDGLGFVWDTSPGA